MAVTSPGVEAQRPFLPPELEAAAWRSSNEHLAWADTSKRGFMLVDLSAEKHHIEFIAVDSSSPSRGAHEGTACLAAFEVVDRQRELQPGSCRSSMEAEAVPVPSAVPLLVPLLLACCLGSALGCFFGRCCRRLHDKRRAKYEQHVDEGEQVPPQRMGIEVR